MTNFGARAPLLCVPFLSLTTTESTMVAAALTVFKQSIRAWVARAAAAIISR